MAALLTSLLRIEPECFLQLSGIRSLWGTNMARIKLTNITSRTVAVHVKVTAPKVYRVNSVDNTANWILLPLSDLEIQVALEPGSTPLSNHRFLVQAAFVTWTETFTTAQERAKKFANLPKDQIHQHQLSVDIESIELTFSPPDRSETGGGLSVEQKYDELVQYTLSLEKEKKNEENKHAELKLKYEELQAQSEDDLCRSVDHVGAETLLAQENAELKLKLEELQGKCHELGAKSTSVSKDSTLRGALNGDDLQHACFSRALIPWLRCSGDVTAMRGGYGVTEITDTFVLERGAILANWNRSGKAGNANPYVLSRIEAIDSSTYCAAFDIKVNQIEARRTQGSNAFNQKFVDPDGEKAAVLELAKERFWRTDGLARANLALIYHGCEIAIADSICSNGFANISARDNGYLGSGLYATSSTEYACMYATGAIDGAEVPPNSAGEHVIIAAWAVPGLIYPMSRTVDYTVGEEYSNFYSPPPSPASALKSAFDSHYACISQKTYQVVDRIRDGIAPDFDEWVFRDGQQLLPAYRIFFKSS